MNYKIALEEAHQRIKKHIHQTPVLTSNSINEIAGAELFFKCENLQRAGAFKIRGACNAMLKLSQAQRENGVITHSSGNMAQAVSLAAKTLGIKAYIVMPNNAPKVKQNAVKSYGGEITLVEPTMEAREAHTQIIIEKTGASFIHPSNDLNVILGQGTAAMELLNIHNDLDVVITPVGGGGLLAGSALAVEAYGNNCKIMAGEPLAVDDAYRSLHSGKIETNLTSNTIADGLRTNLGDINFPIIQRLVDQIIRVEEQEIRQALKLILERMNILVEPSCAVPLAAIIKEKAQFKNLKIGVILSGGNIDLNRIPEFIIS